MLLILSCGGKEIESFTTVFTYPETVLLVRTCEVFDFFLVLLLLFLLFCYDDDDLMIVVTIEGVHHMFVSLPLFSFFISLSSD